MNQLTKDVIKAIQENTHRTVGPFEVRSKECCRCGWESKVTYEGTPLFKVYDSYDTEWNEVTRVRIEIARLEKKHLDPEVLDLLNGVLKVFRTSRKLFERSGKFFIEVYYGDILEVWNDYIEGDDFHDDLGCRETPEQRIRISEFPRVH
jgi:hypothetical protein